MAWQLLQIWPVIYDVHKSLPDTFALKIYIYIWIREFDKRMVSHKDQRGQGR